MTESEYARRVAEIDRLLNDPNTAMDARKVWSLLADVADHPATGTPRRPDVGEPDDPGVPSSSSGRQRGSGA